MGLWAGDTPEVRAADAEPWDAPFSSAMRPFTIRGIRELAYASAFLYLTIPLCGLALLIDSANLTHPVVFWAVVGYGSATAIGLLVVPALIPPRSLRQIAPFFTLLNLVLGSVVTTGLAVGIGSSSTIIFASYINTALFACYAMPRLWAAACVGIVMLNFAAFEAFGPGVELPVFSWMVVFAVVVVGSVTMGSLAQRGDRLAASEGQARRELAVANELLATRVESQSGEIDRLGELRRFLSPQVADAVLSNGTSALAKPHRQRIAVFFCDLRGFTAFTNNAEPEDVVGVLDEYYATVGQLLEKYDATIGDYAGDGVMAYFGDPVPRHDAALAAVTMVHELRPELDRLTARWDRSGHALGYAVGIAFGYATLGVVGFEGRYEYTALGAVVNLGARLCSQASSGQVLLDHPTHAATTEHLASARIEDLQLKGYGTPTRAYALL